MIFFFLSSASIPILPSPAPPRAARMPVLTSEPWLCSESEPGRSRPRDLCGDLPNPSMPFSQKVKQFGRPLLRPAPAKVCERADLARPFISSSFYYPRLLHPAASSAHHTQEERERCGFEQTHSCFALNFFSGALSQDFPYPYSRLSGFQMFESRG